MIPGSLEEIKDALIQLQDKMRLQENNLSVQISHCHKSQKTSAKNLIHYLTLRNEDIRDLQDKLHNHGLSSLTSAESHILDQIQSVRERLGDFVSPKTTSKSKSLSIKSLLRERTEMLFGTSEAKDLPSIMVTFDTGFAHNYSLIKSLLQNGMRVARINCAHDDERVWYKMIALVKKASKNTGIDCKIYMDLAGPKIRTNLTHKGLKKGKVKIKEGDIIWLAEKEQKFSSKDIVIFPNVSGIIPGLASGNHVFIDDGMIKAEVIKVFKNKAKIKILRASGETPKIKNGKGINFPESNLNISALTDFDIECLPFICKYADLIGYSFVRKPEDLELLNTKLSELQKKPPRLIIKIETPEAVQNLPALLLKGMQNEVFGVMIARGDLAVEIGFERMGEIQEEIIWICEAAHVPVIWATQVLENLNKSGLATRSEITDAGRATMAECVMINKGDYTLEVVKSLKEILLRMSGHYLKKRYLFRPLNIAKKFLTENHK